MPNLARAGSAAPLVLVLLFTPFRMGMQISGGLDPNATVNAWGGPTYLGALLAHYLDNIVSFYAAAFLLSRLLLPQPPPGSSMRESVAARNRPEPDNPGRTAGIPHPAASPRRNGSGYLATSAHTHARPCHSS